MYVHKIALYINKTGSFSTKCCNVKSMIYKNTPLYFIVLFFGFSSFFLPNFCCFSHIFESFLFLLLGDTVKLYSIYVVFAHLFLLFFLLSSNISCLMLLFIFFLVICLSLHDSVPFFLKALYKFLEDFLITEHKNSGLTDSFPF
jgi:hypothetical protein